MGKIEARLAELGIELPPAAIPKAAKIETYMIYNGTLRVSGQLPALGGNIKYIGHVGRERSLEEGQAAARLSDPPFQWRAGLPPACSERLPRMYPSPSW